MEFSYRHGAVLLLVGVVAGGCHRMALSPKIAAPPAPVRYTPARDGLPTVRIWKSQIAFGDINGDGLPDIGAVSRLADGPWIWKGDGAGHWADASAGLPRESFCGGGMRFGDVNKDGKMDVAIADHCRGVSVYLGDGTGHWTNSSRGFDSFGTEDVALGDLNGDGCLDAVVVASSDEGVRVYNGDCKGGWKASSGTGLAHSEWGNSVTVADMNGDGNLDIIAAYSAGPRVWLGDGKGNWREASEGLPAPEIHGLYWGVAVGDVNGDGRPDVVSGAALPGVQVFIQDPNGAFHDTASTQCGGGARNGSFCLNDSDCPGATCATAVCKGVCVAVEAGKKCKGNAECPGGTCSQGTCTLSSAGKSCVADGDCGGGSCKHGPNVGGACTVGGGAEQCGGDTCARVNNTHGIPAMNALGVALGDLNNDGKMDVVAVGKTNLEEIGGVYGVFPLLGDGAGNWNLLDNTGLPTTGRERTWGVGLADIDRDGVLDIGVAFGDVLSPTWRSGPAQRSADLAKRKAKEGKKEGKEGKDAKAGAKEKPNPPERGMFGAIEVWRGQITR